MRIFLYCLSESKMKMDLSTVGSAEYFPQLKNLKSTPALLGSKRHRCAVLYPEYRK
jgi:hypothetical protein